MGYNRQVPLNFTTAQNLLLNPEPFHPEEFFWLWREVLWIYSRGEYSAHFLILTLTEREATISLDQKRLIEPSRKPLSCPKLHESNERKSSCSVRTTEAQPISAQSCVPLVSKVVGCPRAPSNDWWWAEGNHDQNLKTRKDEIFLLPRSCMWRAGKESSFHSKGIKDSFKSVSQEKGKLCKQ